MSASSNSTPRLFISHKHIDSNIADVIRSFVTMHSGGRISVFQSSSPWADAPKVGRNLNKQLREALWETSVVILVYTIPDQDWSYCMWECGVASHPQSPDTKIILFQCAGGSPMLFAEQVNVNARDLVDIQKFVDEFLTSPDFFPAFQGPITKFVPHGQEVASAAADFYQKIKPVLPPEKEDPSIEWPAYPFLQLELGISHVDRINNLETHERAKSAYKILQQECVISTADKYCEQLFGVPSFPCGMTLKKLIETWRESHPDSESKWVRALCSQILAGVMWKFPPTSWELMQGLSDSVWHAPVLNRVRKLPGRHCMQFDIYFYKFGIKAGEKSFRINIPETAGQRDRNLLATEEEGSGAKQKTSTLKMLPDVRESRISRAKGISKGNRGAVKSKRSKGRNRNIS